MIYRPGSMLHWEGLELDYRIVADEAEEAEALAQGWHVSPHGDPKDPLDHDGDGKKGGSLPGEQSIRRRGRPRKVSQ